jgi:hypothetical protein
MSDQPIGGQILKHGASVYADDAILFSKPNKMNFSAISEILTLFGNATGIKANLGLLM